MKLKGLHTVASYAEALKAFVAKNENYVPKFYSDGVGVPTIGMGYALTKQPNWFSDFTAAGITLTSAQKSAIEALYTYALSHAGNNAAVTSYIANTYNNNAISLTPNQNSGLFFAIKQKYEDQAIAVMGNANKDTKEFVVLVDIAYNMGNIGSHLTKAIQDGNRAEAWYEIRYNSNNPSNNPKSSYQTVGVGIANRRIIQSDYLGLYSSNPTEDDYKQIMRMYTLHKDKIFEVEHDSTAPTQNQHANQPPVTIGSAYIGHKASSEISPAYNYLKDHYGLQYMQSHYPNVPAPHPLAMSSAPLMSSMMSGAVALAAANTGDEPLYDEEVIVGAGVSEEYAELETTFNDTDLTGTDQNDLVFLGRGNDTFHGNGGDDVIYAGDDSDTVYGDSGDDFLIGEAGTDHLYGGAGNDTLFGMDGYGTSDNGEADYLYGGADFDTYIAGDGDTISDDDGKGMVTFEGDILTGGTLTESHELYDQYEGDGGTYYLLKTNNTLIFQKEEQFLTIENYHKDNNDLGIKLDSELPELTIIGNMANENDGTVTGKVVLTQAYGRDIIVHLSTLDDTAHAGEDYQSDNDITVTIAAGETEGDFSVNLIDDQRVEGRETFFTQIDSVTDTSNQPINYTIKDITPLTIEDDDGLNVSVFAPTVSENVGIATGAVTINKTYDKDLTITLYTQDDSAVSGGSYPDYVRNDAITVTIAAGSTYTEFNVGIVDDDKPEPTETFYALVQSVVDSSGTAVDYTLVEAQPITIEDDDPDSPDPDPTPEPHYVTVSVSDAQNVESGGTISFVVSLSEVLSKDVSIDFITQDGTAVTGSDYIQYGRYGVTIPAGQRSAVYQVVLLNDEVPEPTETFSLTPYSLSYTGPENVLFSNSATGTIYDDDDPQYVSIHISDASAKERAEHMTFTVSISKELTNAITISTSLGTVTIAAGDRSANVYASWPNDTIVEPDQTFSVAVSGYSYSGSEQIKVLNDTSTGTIIDDDPEPEPPHPSPYSPETPQPHDPLVLDMNQDGKISTIALSDSQVFFDITGDGVKERVGWIAPEDGLLVYDKNMNGKIDGVSEVFGKDGLSGFAELRSVADSNYDNVIDRRDALFSQLKVWQDTNSDGISQATELKSLSNAGVKNIELNVIGTNINLNGNLLSEAGRYGDSARDRELAADIQLLATERVNSSNTPNIYTIDPITETLPVMRGYGYIDNSFKAYNLDPKLKELALTFMNDKEHASANFGEFILRWSGFYDMAKSKGVSEITHTFKSNSTQRKVA